MKGLHFKKVPGGTYQFRFYVGDFYVPIEEEIIRDLKTQANAAPQEFLNLIIAKLGYNAYLTNAIQEVLNHSNDPVAQAKTLLAEIRAL